jgi:hypothetical protein
MYPKLQATQISGPDGEPVEVTEIDINRILDDPALVEAAQRLALASGNDVSSEPIPSPFTNNRLP